MPWTDAFVPTLIGVAGLVALTSAVLLGYRVHRPWSAAFAVLRGMIQLAAVAFVLSGVITNPVWVGLALAVMFGVAVATASNRIGGSGRQLAVIGSGMGAGVLASLTLVFVTGALELSPRYALAIGGIVIGNSMSIATLAGRRCSQTIAHDWDEVEAWLALGATPRQATATIARSAVRESLIPTVDQTKTTGTVTLPGAFVGAIFGGASPLEAGRFQIVVLAAIMAAGAIAAVLIVHQLSPVRHKPALLR
ncbi:MAG: ABC transporter permease [Propionicimonas sp.]